MDTFNQWIQQFITSKGRGTYRPKGTSKSNKIIGKPFIGVRGMNHPLFLDTPEFNEWLEDKREAFAGLEYHNKQLSLETNG